MFFLYARELSHISFCAYRPHIIPHKKKRYSKSKYIVKCLTRASLRLVAQRYGQSVFK